jgi:hypothetical protein
MEKEEIGYGTRPENDYVGKLRRHAIDQLAIGSMVLLWGCLLALKQVGIIDKSLSIWPFPFTLLGILLVAGGIYRLQRSRSMSETTRNK